MMERTIQVGDRIRDASLVEQLRAHANAYGQSPHMRGLLREAADELDRLHRTALDACQRVADEASDTKHAQGATRVAVELRRVWGLPEPPPSIRTARKVA